VSTESQVPDGPDLAEGVAFDTLIDGGMLAGRVGDEAVLLARRGDDIFAVGATCSHYGAPLADGQLVGETVRCPWHHASFCLRTGRVLRAPALDPIPCWRVERRDGMVHVREKQAPEAPPAIGAAPGMPRSVVIVGGGAAGNAAAETLRSEGYSGRLTILSADADIPCDRPNLSKTYLAGTSPEAFNLLRSEAFYEDRGIDLHLSTRVAAIDPTAREVRLEDGGRHRYDALLLATGAEPVRLNVPGSDQRNVHYLRTLADSQALVAKLPRVTRVVVVGASFIGMEAAAALRARGVHVEVVAPDRVPMERVLGREVGAYVRRLHEDHGTVFHLGTSIASIDAQGVLLTNGRGIAADLVVVGIGVRPAIALAEQAGLALDRGVAVDAFLETSAPGIFAAGDIARWPDPFSGEAIRVEHWVVAERQGQTAARNMLGRRERFEAVPFFWTEQFDFSLAYVGHAERWDRYEIDGSLEARDASITYWRGGERLAVALVHRDLAGIRSEMAFERIIAERQAGASGTAPPARRENAGARAKVEV
jgi:NADPH-dependent 2,4-dienoyl-CoA reductase/sulfur reductase-like enzyme/nitrite reductase/ring-hydroxylating ferredoxin subunit